MPGRRLGVAATLLSLVFTFGCSRTLPVPLDLDDDASEPPKDSGPDVASPDVADVHELPEAEPDGGIDGGLPPGVTLLAGDQLFPQGLALSEENVFWTNGGDLDDAGVAVPMSGSVAMTQRKGVGPSAVIASGLDEPLALAYEPLGDILAFSVAGTTPAAGSVLELQFDTGIVSTLAETVTSPYGVALDETNAYWVGDLASTAAVQTSSLGTDMPATITTAFGFTFPAGVATNGDTAFFAAQNATGGGGALLSCPLGGGSPKLLWETTGKPFGVAVDGDNVYWVDHDGGAVYQMVQDGGPVVTLASGLSDPFFVAVDSLSVYFATNIAGGSVYEASIGGGRVVELATGLPYPGAVAADDDDDFVYFTLESGIARVQKQ